MKYQSEPLVTQGAPIKTGILLVNLGTPDAPTPRALRSYLKEFLSDPRVVEMPRAIWWLILNGIILNVRPRKSAAKYAGIWMEGGSPLRVHTERQAVLMQELLDRRTNAPLLVQHAMRYGNPGIAKVLHGLKEQNCQRILVVPMYPQYAASTTATVCDIVFDELRQMRNIPALRTVRSFCDHAGYIRASANNIGEYWAKHGRPEKLLMSFHGLPQQMIDRGDFYYGECQVTARMLAHALGLRPEQYAVSFQSRLGRQEWLKPYTSSILRELGRQGMKRLDVVCPGFVADCLETLEEIAQEGRESFQHAGGGEYHYINCLNSRDDWLNALADLVMDNLQGW